MPRAKLFDAADYLDKPETIAAYLTEALESNDPVAIELAKAAAARALAQGTRSSPASRLGNKQ
jgi:DNA-binding phage protein